VITLSFPTGTTVTYEGMEFAAFCTHLDRLGGRGVLKPLTDAEKGDRRVIVPFDCWKVANELRRVAGQMALPGLDPVDRPKLTRLISGLEAAATSNTPTIVNDPAAVAA
jgi:hypothetical protein